MLLLTVLVSALDLALIVLIAQLVEKMSAGGGRPIRALVLIVISAAWFVSFSRSSISLWQSRLTLEVWEDISQKLLERLLHQPYTFHLQQDRVSLSSEIQQQLSQLRRNTLSPLLQALGSGITVLMLTVGLLILTGPGSLLALALVVCGYILQVALLRPTLLRMSSAEMAAEREYNNLLVDALGGIRRLLLEKGQATLLKQQAVIGQLIVANGSWAGILPQLPRQLVEPLGLTVVLLLLLHPGIRSNGASSLPWLALLTIGLLRLSQPLQHLSESFARLQSSRPILSELLSMVELPLPTTTWQKPALSNWKALQLRGISLHYRDGSASVLQDLDLSLKRGERVALVGASGAGKSSLAAVLLGLLIPEKGEIVVDGAVLRPESLEAWQQQCAEVGQPVRLLRGTVRSNLIGFAEPPAEAALWKVLEQVDLADQVECLPQGLDTKLKEDGQGLSGGERQRLALAAALLRRPGLLVLDEATSGVEEARTELIMKQLDQLKEHPAVVVITHREAVMRCCERMVVLEQGKIVASGAFGDLKQRCKTLQLLLAQAKAKV
jgi:ATP-binding cassette, subfamily B, bacterial